MNETMNKLLLKIQSERFSEDVLLRSKKSTAYYRFKHFCNDFIDKNPDDITWNKIGSIIFGVG